MSIMSGEYCDPEPKELTRFTDELTMEIVDLQSKHTDLSNMLFSMEAGILNVQQQTKNHVKEQSMVSPLTKFKCKQHEGKCQSRCVASPWHINVAQDSTKSIAF